MRAVAFARSKMRSMQVTQDQVARSLEILVSERTAALAEGGEGGVGADGGVGVAVALPIQR